VENGTTATHALADVRDRVKCDTLHERKREGALMRSNVIIAIFVLVIIGSGLLAETASPTDAGITKGDSPMKPEALAEAHRCFAPECFNQCWNFIDKAQRTPEDVEMMLSLAQASFWHWKNRPDCAPSNTSVSYWQLSRVHALAGMQDTARFYGERCLTFSQDNNLPPFYIGYGYEAMARAAALSQQPAEAKRCLDLADREAAKITDAEEKKLLTDDLAALRLMVAD
jgi:hypothetical protein